MSQVDHTGLPFFKMHGLGNDFVVLDGRARDLGLTPALIMAIADRHRGIGFDQLAVITQDMGDAHLTFYNADGSTSAACGNATRCIARHLMAETGKTRLDLSTARGGMGNPHCTFFVADAEAVPLEQFGPRYEHHPLYPERTNVQVATVIGTDHIRMRVWERGVGVTLASGSSSCATAVAAARRGLTGRAVRIDLDGGTIHVDWREDGVWMTGETAHVASGVFTPAFLAVHR